MPESHMRNVGPLAGATGRDVGTYGEHRVDYINDFSCLTASLHGRSLMCTQEDILGAFKTAGVLPVSFCVPGSCASMLCDRWVRACETTETFGEARREPCWHTYNAPQQFCGVPT